MFASKYQLDMGTQLITLHLLIEKEVECEDNLKSEWVIFDGASPTWALSMKLIGLVVSVLNFMNEDLYSFVFFNFPLQNQFQFI